MTQHPDEQDPRVLPLDSQAHRELDALAGERTRLFTRFAVFEGLALVILVALTYVLDVLERNLGLILLVGVAMFGAAVLATLLMRQVQAQRGILERFEERRNAAPDA